MKRRYLLLYVIAGLLSLFHPEFSVARNAPITTAGSSIVCPAGAAVVPVTVTGFTSVKAITLRLDFDPTQLAFVNYTNLNPSIASASVNTVIVSPTLAKIMIVWSDLNALTLPTGAKLLDLNFTLTTGSPVVSFNNTSSGGGECEYADENGAAMNDIPTATYYINSTITNNAIAPAGTITGTNVLCAGTSNVGYSVPVITNATGYAWTVPTGGSIISGNNTRSIVVNYSTSAVSGNVTVKGTNTCGQGTPSSLAVTVNPLPVPVITGVGTTCAGSTGITYSTASGMTNYAWTISPGGNITAGTGTNTVTVTWTTAGAQSISVNYTNSNGCTGAAPTLKPVTVNSLPVPTITGNSNVCVGSTNISYTTEPAMSVYTWTISAGGTIISGAATNSILVNWNTAGPQSITVNYTIPATGCFAAIPTSKAITVNTLPVPTITGPASVCAGSSGNIYMTEPGMTGYLWNISAGGILTSGGGPNDNTVTVTWNNAGPQSVTLNYTTSVGCTAATPTSKVVTVNALPLPTITGPGSVCAGSAGNVYTTETGMTGYLWTLSAGGSMTSGGGPTNNSITITWNVAAPQSVSVNYSNAAGCAAQVPTVKNIAVNSLPAPTITGVATTCEGTTGVTYATEPGMLNYLWTISPGGMITNGSGTNNILVSWNSAGTQTITVNYANANGCTAVTPASKDVTVAPLPGAAGIITGTASVCAGDIAIPYSTAAIPNASTYAWIVPTGATISSGAGTNSITLNFSSNAVSGNITVIGSNSCGSGVPSPAFPVLISQMPVAAGTISGPDTVCAGTNGVIYSVPVITNATTYDWTIPAGAVITSGAGTNQIVVSFSSTPGTGLFTVKGTSVCGSGAISPDFNMAMIASQAAPVVTAVGPLLTSTASTGNQWYYEGIGAIPGATGQTYVATITGWYWTVIAGVGCPSIESNHVYILFEGQDEIHHTNFNIYPVPCDGKFSVSMTSLSSENYTILVYNQIGSKIFERDDVPVNGTLELQIDIRPVASGIYSVVFLNRDQAVVRKVLVK